MAGDVLSDSYTTASFADASVGNNKQVTANGIAISGTDAGNYTLALTTATTTANITPATLVVTVTGVTARNKVYDGTMTATVDASAAVLHGVQQGDVVTLNSSAASGTFTGKNVGTGITVKVAGLTLAGANAGNYTLTQPTTTANITAATVSGSCTAAGKVYDGGTSATILTRSFTTTPFGTDNLTLVGGTASFADKNVNLVGTPKTVTGTGFTLGGTDAGNYQLASSTLTTTANITAATVSGNFTAADKVYDGGTSATILTRTITTGVIGTDAVTLAGGTASFADKNVNLVGSPKTVTGTGFTLAGTDAGNYQLASSTLTTTANITAATVSGNFTAADRVYDGGTSATILTRSFTTTPFGTDNLTLVGGTASFANKNVNLVGTPKTVTGTGFTLGGTDAGNYQLASSTLTTTANITALALTVSATGVNKVYDGTTTATVTLLDNRMAGDVLSDSYTTASFADASVGNNKQVTANGIAISGTDAGNYTLALTTATTTANITPATLVVTVTGVTARNKVYDGTMTATVNASAAVLHGVQQGDVVTLNSSAASGTFTGKNVGTGITVQVAGLTLAGANAGNYTLTQPTTTANITAATISGSCTAAGKVYDGGTSATILTRSFTTTPFGTDNLTLVGGTASFANKNVNPVGTPKTVTGTGFTLGGTDAGNYHLASSTLTTTANITARAVTVTANAQTKVFGQADPALTYKVTTGSLVAGDSFSGSLTRAPGQSLGSHPILQGTLKLSSNYNLTYLGANLTIKAQAAIKITSPASSYKYGQVVNVNVQVYSPSGVGTPTGTVYLVDGDGNHVLGQATLSKSKASFHVSTLGLGVHALRAVYMGDGTFNSLVSAALMVTIR